jgi:hypothetical protein
MDKQEVKSVYEEIVAGLKDIDAVRYDTKYIPYLYLSSATILIIEKPHNYNICVNFRKITINDINIEDIPFSFWQSLKIKKLVYAHDKLYGKQHKEKLLQDRLIDVVQCR